MNITTIFKYVIILCIIGLAAAAIAHHIRIYNELSDANKRILQLNSIISSQNNDIIKMTEDMESNKKKAELELTNIRNQHKKSLEALNKQLEDLQNSVKDLESRSPEECVESMKVLENYNWRL